jgi:hypothetical protein
VLGVKEVPGVDVSVEEALQEEVAELYHSTGSEFGPK